MMPSTWLSELRRLSLLLLATTAVGILLGKVWLGLAIGLALALGWHTYQATRLLSLLNRKVEHSGIRLPSGLWQELAERLLKLRQRNSRQKKMVTRVLKRFRGASEVMPDAVILLGRGDRIEFSNQAARRLLNIHWPAANGKILYRLIALPQLSRYLKRGEFSEPLEFTPPHNNSLMLAMTVTPFGRKSYQRLVLVRDITRVHHLDKTRRDFVANASHEFRTPLTVIHGYLEALSEDSETAKELQRPLQLMLQQTQRMQSVVSDLLVLSRLETDPSDPDRQPLNVPRLIREIVHNAQDVATKSHHQIHSDIDPDIWLKGIPTDLQSIVTNLLFNAIQHTPDGSNIWIRWQHGSSGPLLSVADSGDGIEERHIPRLTERFYRVDSARSRETGGTGLGLAIVRQIMLRHGGELSIKSEPGVGTTFHCSFPEALLLHPDQAVAGE